jgi:DNA-binding beta-propeller fold protein YncE
VRLLADVRVGAVARPPTSAWQGALTWLTGIDQRPPDEGLARPFDVAFAPDGTLLVADPDGPRVLRYDAGGTFLADLSCGDRPWGAPVSVAASLEDVFVSDPGAMAVVRWTPTGCSLLGVGALVRPAGLALAAGQVLVADPPAHQVVALRRDGTVAARWGERGDGPGQLHFPSDVAVGPDGSILVVDTFNCRVVRLDAGGRWLDAFGGPDDASGGLARPKGIAAGSDGTRWVSDAERDLVLVFDATGTFRYAVGAPGAAPGAFSNPAGLAVTHDRLAVADSLNRRIQVFELLGERP